jgi:hypothetical protein
MSRHKTVRLTVSTTSTAIRRANAADHGGRCGLFAFFPAGLSSVPCTRPADTQAEQGTEDRGRQTRSNTARGGGRAQVVKERESGLQEGATGNESENNNNNGNNKINNGNAR